MTARPYSLIVWIVMACLPGVGRAQSLYQFIQSHIDPATGRLTEAAATLPDEPQWRRFSRYRTLPGALEGMGAQHIQWAGSDKAKQVTVLLVQVADGAPGAAQELSNLLRPDDVHTYYQEAIESSVRRIKTPEPQVHDFARRLATESSERGQVKFGLALLGAIADPRDLTIVQNLALHDEFGLYAADALVEIAPEPQRALWDMASRVNGWGRIHAIERMAAATDPALRRWLLTEGFRNSAGEQYLAWHCAVLADLKGALQAEQVDTAVLIGAADLLRALAESSLAKNLRTYADGPEASRLFLEHISQRRDSVSFYLAAHALQDWPAAQRIIADPKWPSRVKKSVADDRADLQQAELAAQKLRLDTFDIHFRRLAAGSEVAQRWTLAFRSAGPERAAKLTGLAEKRATSNKTIEAVLQGLSQYPGVGVSLVTESIGSTDSRVRRAAVETLVRWGSGFAARDASIRKRLNTAARVESDEALQARMVALLNAD